jgi:MoaA/NifB/PqqE/SkfB family radical SAM enzyme
MDICSARPGGAGVTVPKAPFERVEPVFGFAPFIEDDGHAKCPAQTLVFDAQEDDDLNIGFPHSWVSSLFSVRRLSDLPYLQLQLRNPKQSGELLVFHNGELVDRAELAEGWQHSAVDITSVPTPAELTLEIRGPDGETVDGAAVRAIFMSAAWGRGQRKRLKCSMPFDRMNVLENGEVSMCMCPAWLKAGNVLGNVKDKRIPDIWNDKPYQRVRKLFLDDRIEDVCRKDLCLILGGDVVYGEPSPETISAINDAQTVLSHGVEHLHHDIDQGCNLDCIMCRDSKILPDGKKVERALRDVQDVLDMGSLSHVLWSGAGEVFAMKPVVDLMATDTFSSRDIGLVFTTNLTHFNEKLWKRIGHNRIRFMAVSADGCTPEVYNNIRLGGDWATIENNLQLAARLRREGTLEKLIWNYTLMRQNVADVGRAVQLAQDLGFDNLRFIGQFGERIRTGGNMFEECDIDALDRLYEQLAQVDAFNKPWIWMSEIGMRGRRYRAPDFRLTYAEQMHDRAGGLPPEALRVYNRAKSSKIIRNLMDDSNAGKLELPLQLTDANTAFLQRFIDQAGFKSNFWNLYLAPGRRNGADPIDNVTLWRWISELLTSKAKGESAGSRRAMQS